MIRCLDCKKALTKGIISKAVKGEIESTFHNRNYYDALLDSVEFPRVRLFLDISSTEIHNTVGPGVNKCITRIDKQVQPKRNLGRSIFSAVSIM